jgi:hypothetical protein
MAYEEALDEALAFGWIDAEGEIVDPSFRSPEQGAATGLWAATSPQLDGRGGLYCEDCDVAPVATPGGSMDDGGVKEYAIDLDSADRLWTVSADLTGVHPAWS